MTADSRPEPRARAQYGEYASPEEQARARGLNGAVGAESAVESAVESPRSSTERASTRRSPITPSVVPSASPTGAQPAASKHPVDRFVTLALLAFGLITVATSIPGYLRMADTLQSAYSQLGIGSYTDNELARSLGVTAIVVSALLWLVTAACTALSLKRNRVSWWIPVVGGALAFIALMVIVFVALLADPAFAASLG